MFKRVKISKKLRQLGFELMVSNSAINSTRPDSAVSKTSAWQARGPENHRS